MNLATLIMEMVNYVMEVIQVEKNMAKNLKPKELLVAVLI